MDDYETHEPISGVHLTLSPSGKNTDTGEDGYYAFNNVQFSHDKIDQRISLLIKQLKTIQQKYRKNISIQKDKINY